MAAPCLHCKIRDLIEEHVLSHPEAVVGGVPVTDLSTIARSVGSVLGELAARAPAAHRPGIVCEALQAACDEGGLSARFVTTGAAASSPSQGLH